MKIAIIGSESFLARNLIKYIQCSSLAKKLILDLYDYTDDTANPVYRYKKVDFDDITSVKEIDFNVDIVFIFTGMTGTVKGFANYEQFIKVNEIYFLNILTAFVDSKTEARIIYPSSRLVYAEHNNPVDEESSIELKSIYAVNKYAAEQYLKIYNSIYGVKYAILSICTPIGSLIDELGNYGTFEIFRKQIYEHGKITIYGDGTQRKTFTKMEDICLAFIKLIGKSPDYRKYNLGGQELSLVQIASKIASEFNAKIEFVEWPQIDYKVDGGTVVFDSKRFDDEFEMTYQNII